MNKKIAVFLFAFVLCMSLASAIITTTSSSARDVVYSTPRSLSSADVNTYWPVITDNQENFCRNRQDVLLQMTPAGCQPTVVRSDLLAEQNVPVLCQLDAIKINPLIDIQSIDSMTFSGVYPKEVATTGFYPARAALSSGDRLLNNPILNNVGYVVVILKRQPNESTLPESVRLNLTARIRYDAQNALGVGQANFILPEQSETVYQGSSFKNSFWQGRYFVRADSLTPDRANIVLYHEDRRITSLTVERGKQSGEIFVPGMSTCQASLRVAYDGFEQSGKDRARVEVQVGNQQIDIFDVYKGMSFHNGRCQVTDIFSNADSTGSLSVSCSGNDRAVLSIGVPTQPKTTEEQKAWEAYQNEARATIEEYKKVATLYSAETDGRQMYGELALQRALELAKRANLTIEYADIIALYQKTYPNSGTMKFYASNAQSALKADTSDSSITFRIDGKVVQVRALNFIDAQPSTVDLVIGSQTAAKNYAQGSELILTDDGKNIAIIQSITADSVIIRPKFCATTPNIITSETVREKQATTVCGQRITVQRINSDKLGTIRIIPNVNNVETVTNVSVTVGIEKRAIKLSPQKATEMIDNLNKSIQKWESISQTLGKTVTGLKSACFATAAVLTAKNFIGGLDGTATARRQVMQSPGGWNEFCTDEFRAKKYVSIDACLTANADKINSGVDAAQKVIEQQNIKLKEIDEANKKDSSTFGTVVNTQGSANAYLSHLKDTYGGDPNIQSTINLLDSNSYNNNLISYEEMKELEYNALLLRQPGLNPVQKAQAEKRIEQLKGSINVGLKDAQLASQISNNPLLSKYIGLQVDSYIPKTGVVGNYEGLTYDNTNGKISGVADQDAGKPFDVVTSKGERYLVILSQPDSSNQRVIEKIYSFDGTNAKFIDPAVTTNQPIIGDVKSTFPVFIQKSEASYKNRYVDPKVRYFETDPYKGMPALVPVDVNDGWYAGTKQVLPVFGQQATYQSSGRVSSFWLCNVGPNGREEFEKSNFGDDTCQQFNFYSGQPMTKFAGLSDAKTQELVSRAVRALTDAAQQHASGVRKVTLGNQRYDVGSPSVNVPAVRCQDYMSPKECLTLFNVCDPVICPSSRCNLGGQYNVANVPETGIVGSALLCLPNAREGIVLPVCLTGLQTGVDGFVSVMKSHRDCLQEQLQTGRTVGICDQIYSIYMCEFFWRQVAPVANILLPKLVESAYGQSVQGGGEYLTVMDAWKQTQQSVSYFTQQYAVNSVKAFQLRSVEEAGGEFCKAFASAKAPTNFKSLVEPDSPPQFHAWFSSIKYSDATVPATSQYKVYYHIFAGKDTGVTYQVYLKSPTGTSFYNVPSQIAVASGFITRGQYASQTRDFTAPEGYKELCVRVNDREECGFQQVSTSFAVNYLTDQTRAEALKQTGVTTSNECVSGSVGTNVALSPNLQTTAESAITPAIYNQGIIRICATNNPGSTSAPGRFVNVGYCDDQKIGCWLDTESTARSITQQNNGTQNEVRDSLQATQNANIMAVQGGNIVFSNTGFSTEYASVKTIYLNLQTLPTSNAQEVAIFKQEAQKAIDKLNEIDSKVFYQNNNQKAQVQLLRAQVFETRADKLKPVKKTATIASSTSPFLSAQQTADLQTLRTKAQNAVGTYSSNEENKNIINDAVRLGALDPKSTRYSEFVGNNLLGKQIPVSEVVKDIDTNLAASSQQTAQSVNTQTNTQQTTTTTSTSPFIPAPGIVLTDYKAILSSTPENAEIKAPSAFGSRISRIIVKKLVSGSLTDVDVTRLYIARNTGSQQRPSYYVYSDSNPNSLFALDLIIIGQLVSYEWTQQENVKGINGESLTVSQEGYARIYLNDNSATKELIGSNTFNLVQGLEIAYADFPSYINIPWTYSTAINKAIILKEKYSQNKQFVDEVYHDGLLTTEEYKEINGDGLWNTEENMEYVKNLLVNKQKSVKP